MAFHQINGIRIRTSHEFPPIPVRDFDWSAVDDDTYDVDCDQDGFFTTCPIGHGATEQDAIDDLLMQIEDADVGNDLVKANGQFGVGA
jgi:hypothetical protein